MFGNRGSYLRETSVRLAGLLAVFIVSASLALAQSSAPKTNSKPPSSDASGATSGIAHLAAQQGIRVQSNLVTAPVTVTNKVTGEFVYDLKKKNFQVYDNGKLQKITGFSHESNKIAAVILVQNSNAVRPDLGNIKQLAPLFSQLMLGPKGEAAVITFGSTVKTVQGFSSSEATLDKTLHAVDTDGSKARLNDALMQAMNLLKQRPRDERRVILAFSTGHDSGSQTSKAEIIRRATNLEVEIYGLGLSLTKSYLNEDKQPMNTPNTPENVNVTTPPVPGHANTPSSSMGTFGAVVPAGGAIRAAFRAIPNVLLSNALATYARYTGGVFYSQWSKNALQVHLGEIAANIHSQYLLAYVPNDLSERGFHKLEVKVSRKDVKIRTRLGYYYEGPKQ